MLLFAGSSHPELAREIAKALKISLAPLELGRFPDQEISLRLLESVRGQDVFVLQSIVGSPNEYLMELLLLLDALKRASAASITAVIPYFGYCRQDRKDRPRVPIAAKLVAAMVQNAGATHVVTMDLHAGQLEGFFDIPVDHLHGVPVLGQAVKELQLKDCVVVAPDIGSVKQARAYASFLKADFAVIDKRRISATEVEASTVIGEVKGKDVLLADDMCSTGGTLVSAAKACREKGAKRIVGAVTHAILAGDALEKIQQSPLDALLVSNTVPRHPRLERVKKVHYLSVAEPFAHAIRCIASQEPIFN